MPILHPPPIEPTHELEPQDSGSGFKGGDVFTLKSNTTVESFGAFWKELDSGEVHMIPCSTNVTVVANAQLEFLEGCGDYVKVKPKLSFQQTIKNIKPHEPTDASMSTLHKGRVKAYNQGAQPTHA